MGTATATASSASLLAGIICNERRSGANSRRRRHTCRRRRHVPGTRGWRPRATGEEAVGDFERDGVLLRAVEELQRLEPVVAGKMITGSGHHRKEQARAKVAGTGGPSSEQRRRQHLLFFLRFSGGSGLRGAAGPVRTPHNTPLQLCGRNCGSSWACGGGPPNGLAAKPAPLASLVMVTTGFCTNH